MGLFAERINSEKRVSLTIEVDDPQGVRLLDKVGHGVGALITKLVSCECNEEKCTLFLMLKKSGRGAAYPRDSGL